MKGWCPVHLHDWPDGLISEPVLGALVNIEWNADLINKYYGWEADWPDDSEQGMIHFMRIWRQLARKKGIKIAPDAKIAFALEGLDFLTDLNNLPEMRNMGLCSMQLAHIGSNSYYDTRCGLTEDGKRLLEIMYELGITLDLSHLHGTMLNKIIRQFPGKRIVSHVVCESLLNWNLMRRSNAMTDEELRMCDAELYGVPFVDELLSPNASMKCNERNVTVETVAKHILHLIDIVGLDKVALGPDYFDYCEFKNVYGVEVRTVLNMDDLLGLSQLAVHLKNSGMNEIQIEHVFWRNAKEFICRLF